MSRDHLIHPSGDQEQDLRRAELLSWRHYFRLSQTLASTPLTNAHGSRERVAQAKADWASAWRALDGVAT